MTKILSIFTLLFSTGCSVFGIRTVEELNYEVLRKDDSIEVRQYAPYIAAQASMEGEKEEVQNDLFRIVAGYIFGKNSSKEKIAMTTPVTMDSESTGESIAMTAPVTMQADQGRWTMAFSMPSKYKLQDLPKPLDERVKLKEVPAQTFAVIRYSGSFSNPEKRAKKTEELQKWLHSQPQYKVTGEPLFAGYDPPFTLPFLRRNEVWIAIE